MRLGVIGLGSIGMRHVRNLLELGEEDVFGCDTRIGEQGFSCTPIQGTNSVDMLWQWKPEVVLICTPPESHFGLCRDALSNDAHVFCEKPLSVDVKGAGWLCLYAEARRRHLAVGYQLRFQLGHIPSGPDLTWECSQDMSQWPSQYQKNVLLEFSHEIDAACYVNGPVRAVWAEEDRYGWFIRLQHFSCVSTILINPQAKQACRDCYTPTLGRVWTFDHAQNDQAYKDELTVFINAVHDGSPFMDKRLCTGPQAAHVLRIIEACQRSQQNYEVVQL